VLLDETREDSLAVCFFRGLLGLNLLPTRGGQALGCEGWDGESKKGLLLANTVIVFRLRKLCAFVVEVLLLSSSLLLLALVTGVQSVLTNSTHSVDPSNDAGLQKSFDD
jgi:hypothetical protein